MTALTDIDHVLTYVHDGAAAERFFRALGFVVSPVSEISAMGIVNRLVLFRDAEPDAANFIELMAVSDTGKLPPQMAVLLQGEQGIKSMVLATGDASVARGHLATLGHDLAAPVHVRREWPLGDGTSVFPAFDVLLPVSAGLTFNACHYHTPDLYKRSNWTAHPNGVTGLVAVLAVAKEPAQIAAAFGAILAAAAEAHADRWVVRGRRVALEVYHPAAFIAAYGTLPAAATDSAARFAGYRLTTTSLDAVRRHAVAAGIPIRDGSSRLLVAADVAPGRLIEFVTKPYAAM